jgi:predicted nucleic acid-binding protein
MGLSRLTNAPTRFVADTSTIINLNGTQCAADILGALSERLVIVDVAAAELDGGKKKGRRDADLLAELKAAGLLDVESLGDVGEAIFEKLVVGPADATLDDGEAATIAYAIEHSLSVVIDDRKARRICRERYSSLPVRCSVELLQHPSINKGLGRDRLSAAVLNALKISRMRVVPDHIEWVVKLIGKANAESCASLPLRKKKQLKEKRTT